MTGVLIAFALAIFVEALRVAKQDEFEFPQTFAMFATAFIAMCGWLCEIVVRGLIALHSLVL